MYSKQARTETRKGNRSDVLARIRAESTRGAGDPTITFNDVCGGGRYPIMLACMVTSGLNKDALGDPTCAVLIKHFVPVVMQDPDVCGVDGVVAPGSPMYGAAYNALEKLFDPDGIHRLFACDVEGLLGGSTLDVVVKNVLKPFVSGGGVCIEKNVSTAAHKALA